MKYGSEQILPYNQEEQKGTQVKRMFDSIAGTYDLLNHTLSCVLFLRNPYWILPPERATWPFPCTGN